MFSDVVKAIMKSKAESRWMTRAAILDNFYPWKQEEVADLLNKMVANGELEANRFLVGLNEVVDPSQMLYRVKEVNK